MVMKTKTAQEGCDERTVTHLNHRTGEGSRPPNWGDTGDRERLGQFLGHDPDEPGCGECPDPDALDWTPRRIRCDSVVSLLRPPQRPAGRAEHELAPMRPRGEAERTRVSIPAATPSWDRHPSGDRARCFAWTPGGTERFLGRRAFGAAACLP